MRSVLVSASRLGKTVTELRGKRDSEPHIKTYVSKFGTVITALGSSPVMNLSRRTGEMVLTTSPMSSNNPRTHGTDDQRWNLQASLYASAEGSGANLLPVLLAVSVACCGAFCFGYHLGVLNGPLHTIAVDLGFAENASLQGLVVSSSLAGAALGSLGGSGVADAVGRRKAFLLDSIPLIVGALLCSMSTGIVSIVIGRAIIGVGIGLSSALVPLYISEVCIPCVWTSLTCGASDACKLWGVMLFIKFNNNKDSLIDYFNIHAYFDHCLSIMEFYQIRHMLRNICRLHPRNCVVPLEVSTS